MIVIINPGTENIAEASLEHAQENMKHFLVDCDGEGLEVVRYPSEDRGGRFGFLVLNHAVGSFASVRMPGLPLEQVRWMQEEGQNPFAYPRLYVDGSSWLWKYAILDERYWADEE